MIELYEGDIFQAPVNIIIHQCNCFNTMGAGIAKEIKNRYPRAAQADQRTLKGDSSKLGTFTVANPSYHQDKCIINLYGQFGYGRDKRYTDYKAVRQGLESVVLWLYRQHWVKPVIGIPYGMGCQNAGGDWKIVEKLIREVFEQSRITVLICKNIS